MSSRKFCPLFGNFGLGFLTGWLAHHQIYSNGHGCMLQYALLHLFGYDLSIDDLKAFRVSFSSILVVVPPWDMRN